ncbi:MAG: hypothetical protein RLN76_00635 [Phycisphaeraceae bacterium]
MLYRFFALALTASVLMVGPVWAQMISVLTADGRPAANAYVFLAYLDIDEKQVEAELQQRFRGANILEGVLEDERQRMLKPSNFRVYLRDETLRMQSHDMGQVLVELDPEHPPDRHRFALPAELPDSGFWVLARTDEGIITQWSTGADDLTLTIEPWARAHIENRLFPEGYEVEGMWFTSTIDHQEAGAPSVLQLQQHIDPVTPRVFLAERLPKGRLQMMSAVPSPAGSSGHLYVLPDRPMLEPGGSVELTVRPKRAAMGRLEFSNPLPDDGRYHASMFIRYPPQQSDSSIPEHVRAMGLAERQQWIATDEGRAWVEARQRSVSQSRPTRHVQVYLLDEDGHFYIPDAAPGQVTMQASIMSYGGDHQEQLLSTRLELTIPDHPSDGVIDLGTFPVEVASIQPKIGPGDEAPEINAWYTTGTRGKLSDHRGKYVLMTFTHSHDPTCTELDQAMLNEWRIPRRYPDLVILNLVINEDKGSRLGYVRKNKIPWPELLLGGVRFTKADDDYGVRRFPSTWIVDPDGVILAANLKPDQILEALEEHLPMP